MKDFMSWCQVHGKNPQEGCTECGTAEDVNTTGHRQGNCIPQSCQWCQRGFPRGKR